MNDKIQKLDCPVCQNPIYFNAKQLLSGQIFACNNCSATVSLTQESTPIVSKAMNKLETLKQKH